METAFPISPDLFPWPVNILSVASPAQSCLSIRSGAAAAMEMESKPVSVRRSAAGRPMGQTPAGQSKATMVVDIETAPESIHDWDALGHAIGSRLPAHAVPVLAGNFNRPNAIRLKSFFASLACAAGTELCHIIGLTPEAHLIERALENRDTLEQIAITAEMAAATIDALNPHDRRKIDYISLGCPHYHIDEIRRIAAYLDGKRTHPDTVVHIWTAGTIKYQAGPLRLYRYNRKFGRQNSDRQLPLLARISRWRGDGRLRFSQAADVGRTGNKGETVLRIQAAMPRIGHQRQWEGR